MDPSRCTLLHTDPETTIAHHDPTMWRFLRWVCRSCRYSESYAKPILYLLSSDANYRGFFFLCVFRFVFFRGFVFCCLCMVGVVWVEISIAQVHNRLDSSDWFKCVLYYILVAVVNKTYAQKERDRGQKVIKRKQNDVQVKQYPCGRVLVFVVVVDGWG